MIEIIPPGRIAGDAGRRGNHRGCRTRGWSHHRPPIGRFESQSVNSEVIRPERPRQPRLDEVFHFHLEVPPHDGFQREAGLVVVGLGELPVQRAGDGGERVEQIGVEMDAAAGIEDLHRFAEGDAFQPITS